MNKRAKIGLIVGVLSSIAAGVIYVAGFPFAKEWGWAFCAALSAAGFYSFLDEYAKD